MYAIEPHVDSFADHIGYKLFGILPELVENRVGRNDHIAAYFFAAFSALNVLLLAAIAFRLSGSRRAFDLTLVAAALSASLLIYARFLVPYDLSLCFALLALWVGVKRPAGYVRSACVGALAAWAFFSYYGYWQIAGIAVLLHALWLGGSLLGFLRRLCASGAGFLLVVLGFLGLSHLGRGTLIADMVEITKYQAVGAVDFRSGLNTWAYLFHAGGRGALSSGWRPLRPGSGSRAADRGQGCFRRLYSQPWASWPSSRSSSSTRTFAITSWSTAGTRGSSHPSSYSGFGLGLDRLCARLRLGNLLALGAAAALALNALFLLSAPLAQEFPKDFKVRAEKVLQAQPAITDGSSYYRLVNVDHFVYEPEILRSEPKQTLPREPAPAPIPAVPLRGGVAEMKALRRSVDHRMRLVQMEVPQASRIGGGPFGVVTLRVQFPAGRAGYKEPLLAIGPRGAGDLFFVNYLTASAARLGFESIGGTVLESEPFDYAPGAVRTLRLFSGSLMPNDGHAVADKDPAVDAIFREKVYATLDGRVLLEHSLARHDSEPGQVFAGVNTVEADSAGDQFWGTILSAERGVVARPGRRGSARA